MLSYLKYLANLTYHSILEPAGPFFKESDYPDLTNHKWLVTGATGGIGYEICKTLIKLNAELWIVGRSKEKLDETATSLKKVNPSGVIHIVIIDYNDLQSVKSGASKIKEQTGSLNGIIHNAGLFRPPPGAKTAQGLEVTVGVNNVATQLLQDLLDPLVINTPGARIVWLSSIALIFAPSNGFSAETVANGSDFVLYSLSKALNYIQAVQWSKKHPNNTNVKSIAVHPGAIRSGLSRNLNPYVRKASNLFFYEAPYGALAPIYAALSPAAANNDFIVPFGRPGPVRPDIYEAARNEHGAAAVAWIEDKIKSTI